MGWQGARPLAGLAPIRKTAPVRPAHRLHHLETLDRRRPAATLRPPRAGGFANREACPSSLRTHSDRTAGPCAIRSSQWPPVRPQWWMWLSLMMTSIDPNSLSPAISAPACQPRVAMSWMVLPSMVQNIPPRLPWIPFLPQRGMWFRRTMWQTVFTRDQACPSGPLSRSSKSTSGGWSSIGSVRDLLPCAIPSDYPG